MPVRTVLQSTLPLSVLVIAVGAPITSFAVDPGPPGGLNVNVVNTPLPIQGTVTGTVTVSGTSSVNVVNTPLPVQGTVTGSVSITNPATNPVLVRDVDNPARHAFQQEVDVTFNAGETFVNPTIDVPAGKRLVVEYVSITACLPAGQKLTNAEIRTGATGGNPFVAMIVTPGSTACADLFDGFTASQMVRFYKDAGMGGLVVSVGRNVGTDFGSVDSTIVGYLVDLP